MSQFPAFGSFSYWAHWWPLQQPCRGRSGPASCRGYAGKRWICTMVNFAWMYPLLDPSVLRPHPAKSATPLSPNNARPRTSRYVCVCLKFILGMNSRWHNKEQLSSSTYQKIVILSQPQKQLTSVALLRIDNFLRLFCGIFGGLA